jgi:hypothetical protein
MEGTRQRPMTSRYMLIIGNDVFDRGDEQGLIRSLHVASDDVSECKNYL